MATEIEMPKLGLSMQEGKITKWLNQEGDEVKKGEAIVEISTDKISNVVESPVDGVLLKIYYEKDEVVPVHKTIAVVGKAGEKIEDVSKTEEEKEEIETKQKEKSKVDISKDEDVSSLAKKDIDGEVSPVAAEYAKKAGINVSEIVGTGPKGRIMKNDVKKYLEKNDIELPKESLAGYGTEEVSPIAHKLAEEYDLNLENINGSGPKERILKNDVLEYIEENKIEKTKIKTEEQKVSYDKISPVAKKLCEEANINSRNITGTGPGERVMKSDVERYISSGRGQALKQLKGKKEKLSGRRQIIADKMQVSKQKAAHASVTIDVEAKDLMELYKSLASKFKTKLNLNALFIKAITKVIKKHPIINASLKGNEVIYHNSINMGIAVDNKNGLIVPVIKKTEDKGLNQLSEEVNILVNKAQNEELAMEEMEDGTITISNLGMYNIKSLTPIINHPEVAIFGIGEIKDKPLIKDGGLFIGKEVNITLSFDHRLIDGAQAARVLNTLKYILENPEELI